MGSSLSNQLDKFPNCYIPSTSPSGANTFIPDSGVPVSIRVRRPRRQRPLSNNESNQVNLSSGPSFDLDDIINSPNRSISYHPGDTTYFPYHPELLNFTDQTNCIDINLNGQISCDQSSVPVVPITAEQTRAVCRAKWQNLRNKMSSTWRHRRAVVPGLVPTRCPLVNHSEQRKQFREFLQSSAGLIGTGPWSYRQLAALLQEYEMLALMKQLTIEAQSARPLPSLLKTDLGALFEHGWCCDLLISYRGVPFNVHRSILSVRCPYFRTRLRRKPTSSSANGNHTKSCNTSSLQQPDLTMLDSPSISASSTAHHRPQILEIEPVPGIDARVFACLLRYLYTGTLTLDESGLAEDSWEVLSTLCQKFGLANHLEQDMRVLLPSIVCNLEDTSSCSCSAQLLSSTSSSSPLDTDCVLIFSQPSSTGSSSDNSYNANIADKDGRYFPHTTLKNYKRHCMNHNHNHSATNHLMSSHPVNSESHLSQQTGQSSSHSFHTTSETATQSGSCTSNEAFYLPCHGAILACRSKLLRGLIERRRQEHSQQKQCNRLGVVLDEQIIPRRLAAPLLHWLYTDKMHPSLLAGLPLSTVSNHNAASRKVGSGYRAGLSQYQSYKQKPSVQKSSSCIEDVMQLYQIGEFLDCLGLCQCCEDLLVDSFNISNVLLVLRWSSEPSGSPVVRRQAIHFIREQFLAIANSSVLLDLTQEEMEEIIASDYLQAPESEVLAAVMYWSKNQLIRMIEKREPNVVSQTTHSVSRRGIRRRDVDDAELAQVMAPLAALVRVGHILPAHAAQLEGAVKRGLIQPPIQASDRSSYWCTAVEARVSGMRQSASNNNFNQSCTDIYRPPRLFTPFYIEARSLVAEHPKMTPTTKPWLPGDFTGSPISPVDSTNGDATLTTSQWLHTSPNYFFPSDANPAISTQSRHLLDVLPVDLAASREVEEAAAIAVVLDRRLVASVWAKTRKLQHSPVIQRAILTLPHLNRAKMLHQLQLRALREAGFPDSMLASVFSGWNSHETLSSQSPSENTVLGSQSLSVGDSDRNNSINQTRSNRSNNNHPDTGVSERLQKSLLSNRISIPLCSPPSIEPPPPPNEAQNIASLDRMTMSTPEANMLGLKHNNHLVERSDSCPHNQPIGLQTPSNVVRHPPPSIPAPPPPAKQTRSWQTPSNHFHNHTYNLHRSQPPILSSNPHPSRHTLSQSNSAKHQQTVNTSLAVNQSNSGTPLVEKNKRHVHHHFHQHHHHHRSAISNSHGWDIVPSISDNSLTERQDNGTTDHIMHLQSTPISNQANLQSITNQSMISCSSYVGPQPDLTVFNAL